MTVSKPNSRTGRSPIEIRTAAFPGKDQQEARKAKGRPPKTSNRRAFPIRRITAATHWMWMLDADGDARRRIRRPLRSVVNDWCVVQIFAGGRFVLLNRSFRRFIGDACRGRFFGLGCGLKAVAG